MASSLGSQHAGGRAFSRPSAGTLNATNQPQRVHPILYQGNMRVCRLRSLDGDVDVFDAVQVECFRE
jgi:hypothetical protein